MDIFPPIERACIEVVALTELMRPHAELLGRIRVAARGSQAEYDRLYLPVLLNYARHVHLLPAARCGHRDAAGGMLRLGLETAFYALQASGAVIFACRETAEARRALEPRWKYATFIAGLCAELHRLNDDLAPDSVVVGRIVPNACLQYLCDGGEQIVAAMLDAIVGAPVTGEISALRRIVDGVRARLAAHEAKPIALARTGIDVQAGQAEPRLVEAMRQLFLRGTWRVNEKKARLWYAADGLYLVWRAAANEIAVLLNPELRQPAPHDREAMGEVLACTGVFDKHAQGGYLWIIRPPGAANDLKAARIANPDLVFAGTDPKPQPLLCTLVRVADSTPDAGRA